jgi:hypothetical protein
LKQSGPIPAGCHFLLPPLFVLPIFSSTKNPTTRQPNGKANQMTLSIIILLAIAPNGIVAVKS